MSQDSTMTTSRASLCALGEYLKRQCFFALMREQVQIPKRPSVIAPSRRSSMAC